MPEHNKMQRRESSISSKADDEDYRIIHAARCGNLDSRGHHLRPPQVEPTQLPQVVTVSSLGELQGALIKRDARICFLEKELVDTRLQLALAKTAQDTLLMELNKTKLALAEATENSSVVAVSEEDDGIDKSSSQHRRASSAPSSYWHNLNPASCASGLRLLAGDLPSGSSASAMRRLSTNPAPDNIAWAGAMNCPEPPPARSTARPPARPRTRRRFPAVRPFPP